ncbi:uncharacterized protein MONBRDRAFT_29913 [Monosiga brevicollis MX1]|uniref:Primary ciliary dyskinesia protein 1 n=1 Tax=Monosiga brevicollis TaxID=81824 RepID=A9VCH5_MONBE|nr:uncharacterized protein MONBRDRAFT_29913 [Monosiga brevicollis MX1]EDQ84752.1 predicted protein [Monosiga brevicollis MX1]|eukprot:XP_001750402.1 hypothetical protein [Monosiga brevicollis MX1]
MAKTVAPPTATATTKHRLIDQHVYSAKEGAESAVQPTPAVIHLSGFTVGQPVKAKLSLLNRSQKQIRTHIVEPQTEFFNIAYSRKGQLVPGSAEELTITFRADELRYYYDCIRVHVEGSSNVLIPLHAYPVKPTLTLPKHHDFGTTALEEEKARTLTFGLNIPLDVDFEARLIEAGPEFTLDVPSYTIPADGQGAVTVKYRPTRYITSSCKVEIKLLTDNAEAAVCNVTGYCQHGLRSAKLVEQALAPEPTPAEGWSFLNQICSRRFHAPPQAPSALPSAPPTAPPATARTGASRRKRSGRITAAKQVQDDISATQAQLVQLSTTRGVARILNQHVVHRHPQHAISVLETNPATRAQRINDFLKEKQERDNQPPGVGHESLSNDERRRILSGRRQILEEYEYLQDLDEQSNREALARLTTVVDDRPMRTCRRIEDANQLQIAVPTHLTFTPEPANEVLRKAQAHERFVRAARKVVIRLRAARYLEYFHHAGRARAALTEVDLAAEEELAVRQASALTQASAVVPSLRPHPWIPLPTEPTIDLVMTAAKVARDSQISAPTPALGLLELETPAEYRLLQYTPVDMRLASELLASASHHMTFVPSEPNIWVEGEVMPRRTTGK